MGIAKKLLFYVAAFTLLILLTALMSEILLRIFFPQQEAMRWFKTSNKYGYVLKRNFHQKYHFLNSNFVMEVATNSFGHRAKEYDLSKPAIRILLLGDSFVFGHGVNIEDRFDTHLQKFLDDSGNDFLIINAAVGGWGTLQEIRYAIDHLDLFKPDIIVITFCGNDPYDDIKFMGNLADNDRGAIYFPGKRFIKENLHLYRWLYYKWHSALHKVMLQRRMGNNKELAIDRQSASAITKEDWGRTFSYLKTFRDDFLRFNPSGMLLLQATNPLSEDIRTNLTSLSNGSTMLYVDLYNDVLTLHQTRERSLMMATGVHVFIRFQQKNSPT